MNLDKLKAIAEATTEVEIGGQTFRLRRISAAEGVALLAPVEGDSKIDNETQKSIFIEAAAKCIVDEAGNPDLDSDEGRAALAALPFPVLMDLGDACLKWQDAKKNLPTKSVSNTDSAL